jgi:carboxyl-terminal processing protease
MTSLTPRRGLFLFTALVLASCPSAKNVPSPASKPTRKTASPQAQGKLDKRPADPRERFIAPTVARILRAEHLRSRSLDGKLSAKAFDRFIKATDYGRYFLLAKHVEALKAHRDKLGEQMMSGKLALVRQADALLRQRIAVVAKVVAAQLAKPFDFGKKEWLETDTDKRSWAKSERALAERWRKMLKLQALSRSQRMVEMLKAAAKAKKLKAKGAKGAGAKAGDKAPEVSAAEKRALARIPKTAAGRDKKARTDLAKRWAGRFARLKSPPPLDGMSTLINAVTRQYDPHTGYLPPATKENFDIHMSGSLEGIGAVLMEDDHYIRIVRIVPGGASWRQGELEAGDLILAVAQKGKESVDVVDARLDRVVRMIRGPKGTVVRLTIKKPDDRVKVVAITRDVIKIETAYARGAELTMRGQRFGYIDLPSFYGNTRRARGATGRRRAAQDVRALLERFAKRKLKGVVLDLRGNGGGLLEDAKDIAGLFIEEGPIVQTRGARGKVEVLADDDKRLVYSGEVVVLVDRNSASASEIVAGALQDYGRAAIVGTGATHGKGTVQVLLSLDRLLGRPGGRALGVLKLTRQQYYRVSGESTQLRGVIPDVLLVDPAGFHKRGERRFDSAIPWNKIAAAPFKRWPATRWTLPALRAASAKRQAISSVFAKYRARNALLRARKADTRVPLHRQRWQAWLEAREKALEAVTPKSKGMVDRFAVKPVIYAKSSAPIRPRPGRKGRKPIKTALQRWRESLPKDAWLAEALEVLGQMTRP